MIIEIYIVSFDSEPELKCGKVPTDILFFKNIAIGKYKSINSSEEIRKI